MKIIKINIYLNNSKNMKLVELFSGKGNVAKFALVRCKARAGSLQSSHWFVAKLALVCFVVFSSTWRGLLKWSI